MLLLKPQIRKQERFLALQTLKIQVETTTLHLGLRIRNLRDLSTSRDSRLHLHRTGSLASCDSRSLLGYEMILDFFWRVSLRYSIEGSINQSSDIARPEKSSFLTGWALRLYQVPPPPLSTLFSSHSRNYNYITHFIERKRDTKHLLLNSFFLSFSLPLCCCSHSVSNLKFTK